MGRGDRLRSARGGQTDRGISQEINVARIECGIDKKFNSREAARLNCVAMRTQMGLLKDIYDIILENPNARSALGKGLESILKGAGFLPQKKPTIREQLDNQQELIKKLSDDDFPNSFPSRLDYLTILLAAIVYTTQLKNRGCFIKTFYSDKLNLYFPCPPSDPKIGKETSPTGASRYFLLGNLFSKKTFYEFYAFERNSETPDPDQMREVLEGIAQAGEGGESEKFRNSIEHFYAKAFVIAGIEQLPGDQGFRFISPSPYKERLGLSFARSKEVRSSIAAELEELLKFKWA
jgi:hypothetical protein